MGGVGWVCRVRTCMLCVWGCRSSPKGSVDTSHAHLILDKFSAHARIILCVRVSRGGGGPAEAQHSQHRCTSCRERTCGMALPLSIGHASTLQGTVHPREDGKAATATTCRLLLRGCVRHLLWCIPVRGGGKAATAGTECCLLLRGSV